MPVSSLEDLLAALVAAQVRPLEAAVRDLAAEVRSLRAARPEANVVRDAGLLTTEAAAAAAGVTPGTVRDWIRAGRLQASRAGRRLRVRRSALEAFLAGSAAVVDLDGEATRLLASGRR